MRFQEVYKKFSERKYYVFSFEDLCTFYPQEERGSLRQCLSRWKKQGWIASLKKGLYELTFPESLSVPDLFIANKMVEPSYVSLETALSHYSILPEVSMAVVSITCKLTRRYKNSHGLFLYRSVQPDAFCGYVIEHHNGFNVLIAEPEKALVDYIYFKSLRAGKFDKTEERIDWKRAAQMNKKKLHHYAEIYHLDLKDVYDA